MSLLRAAATVSGLTMVSRVLGFVRDMMIAGALGSGPMADAFLAAFRMPNLFRRIFAEGAFNNAFVPLYARRLEGEGREAAAHFAREALAGLLAVTALLTFFVIIAMPWVVYLIAPGFSTGVWTWMAETFAFLPDMLTPVAGTAPDPAKLALTIEYARVCFPYLMFISLAALASGILNSHGRFAAAAAAPILLNVILVTVLTCVLVFGWQAGAALSWGVLAAGVAQFVMLAFASRRIGVQLRLLRPRLTPGVRRLVTLGVPGVIAGGATQINLVIGGIIASMQDGAVAWLYYADRLYQLPLGMVGVALGVALLPELSRRLRVDDAAGAVNAQNRGIEMSAALTLPAAAALVAMPWAIVATLFERGAFDAADTQATAAAVAVYGFGLPAFVLVRVLSPAFFAREDTKTPLRFALRTVTLNVILSFALFPAFGHVGIAAANTISAWVNAGMLARELHARKQLSIDARLKTRLPRLFLASLLLGLAMHAGQWLLASPLQAGGLAGVGALTLLCVGGAVAYLALTRTLGAWSLAELKASLKRSR